MFERAVAIGLILAAICAANLGGAFAEDRWAEKYFNPQPADGDLVLPMPCGGAMAFRAVEVPAAGWLGDRELVLGGPDPRFGHAEMTRYAYLAGGFTEGGDPARRRFYLAKYELSQLQRDALGQDCPRTGLRGRLPATALSWFDAVALAERYTAWLLAEAPDALPAEDGVPGHLRLPTEAEWEFAARGGVAVTESEFLERVPPMPEGLPSHAWFGGTKSANGKLQLTGLLAPNPVGLHDMLGNAGEIVLDRFRLNRRGRLHGQTGGIIVKGGDYLTSEGDIRSAYRQEIAPYDADGPKRVETIGTRFVLAVPVLTSRERLAAVRAAWEALPSSLGPGTGTRATEDPAAALDEILAGPLSPDLRQRLEGLSLALGQTLAEQSQAQGRAARGMVRLGAFLSSKLADDMERIRAIAAIYDGRVKAGSAEAVLEKVRANLRRSEAAFEDNLRYYIDTVALAVRDHPAARLATENAALAVEFQSQELDALVGRAELFLIHTNRFRDRGGADRDKWVEEIAAK